MTIINFTPLTAIVGGILIGLGVSILLLFKGRIFGISGILSGIIRLEKEHLWWRLTLFIGLIVGALTAHLIFDTQVPIYRHMNLSGLFLSSILIGFGTRLGSGCTSGHGVCGISRLSKRSIVATLTFMISAILTVAFIR